MPEASIQTFAQGKDHPLSADTIKALEEQNPNKPTRMRATRQTIVWAYNRRVDIVLLPKGTESAQFFPHRVDDVQLLRDAEWQKRSDIEKAGQAKAPEQASGQILPVGN